MKIKEIFEAKAANNELACPTIAFFGDSITQGCFELIPRKEGGFDNVHDRENVYHTRLVRLLAKQYPTVPINVVNAGVAGTTASFGVERIKRDVLSKNPDLTVVCFGLNDCGKEEAGLEEYVSSLSNIFDRLKDAGSEIIFMTQNMMCTQVSANIDPMFLKLANLLSVRQNRGVVDMYFEAAKKICLEKEIPVCDVYANWKALYEQGEDVTELLSNKLNHPTREMHQLFADSLYELMMR